MRADLEMLQDTAGRLRRLSSSGPAAEALTKLEDLASSLMVLTGGEPN
jgi:hypothetical protein